MNGQKTGNILAIAAYLVWERCRSIGRCWTACRRWWFWRFACCAPCFF